MTKMLNAKKGLNPLNEYYSCFTHIFSQVPLLQKASPRLSSCTKNIYI